MKVGHLSECAALLWSIRMKVIREQELDSKKKYIFGYHPHGIIVLSRLATYAGNWEKLFPNIHARGAFKMTFQAKSESKAHNFGSLFCLALGASTMFYVPFGRELCLWCVVRKFVSPLQTTNYACVRLGGVDASRSTADKVLKAGTSITVYPGGVPEIFLVDPKSKEVRHGMACGARDLLLTLFLAL